jgi:hypothetical protein
MKTATKQTAYLLLCILSLCISRFAKAENDYDMGLTTTKEIWVDPVNGKDAPLRGTTRALAVKTVGFAMAFIPSGAELKNTGFIIMLAPGTYSVDNVPALFQSLWGTAEFPVIFQAADDTGVVIFPSVDVTICRYFYMIGIHLTASQRDYVANFRACDHILLRNCTFTGSDSTVVDTAEFGTKFYQCQHVYLEQCSIARPSGNAVDMYSNQYGHIRNCRIDHYGANAILLRGGTGYFTVEENTIHDGGGGITLSSVDTTRGLDNMVMPWVHYDAYDVKCFNNIIHHTLEAGFSCSGGYNVLFAHNTLYETGYTNSLVILGLARRARSVDKDLCQQFMDSGAWGTWYLDRADSDAAPIPNKNIFIYNNIFANTGDSVTASSQFTIAGPLTAAAFNAACPRPAQADDNVKIRGNIMWNGGAHKELGITASSGCGTTNPSCNQTQLYRDNLINSAEPKFVNAAAGNFHPKPGSIIYTIAKTFPIPDFAWTGLPPKPQEPPGNTSNSIPTDRDSLARNPNNPVAGVFVISTSSVNGQEESPDDISLLQNFPNPAHGMTTIEFKLSDRARTKLDIYDILGAKIASLVSSAVDAGDHRIEWNTSAIPAGKYFYRLETENMTLTKQMTVVR